MKGIIFVVTNGTLTAELLELNDRVAEVFWGCLASATVFNVNNIITL